MRNDLWSLKATFVCIAFSVSCSSTTSKSSDDDQMPPTTTQADVEAWLATGKYKSWHCEAAPHAPRGPSAHGPFNRICTNNLVSSNATATGVWPKGAAAVKEFYATQSAATPASYALYAKTQADSANGANWFYYEKAPDGTLYAKGELGATICTGCHGAAGTDAAHTPSPGGRDFVYTPVP